MSAGQYGLGVLVLGVVVVALAITGSGVRRMLLPGWSQAPARVAEGVIALATLVLVGELLGAVGAFRRWPVVLCCSAVASATFVVSHRTGASRHARASLPVADGVPPAPRQGLAPTAGALLVVFLTLIPWMLNTLTALHAGMREFDTLSYHMPFAARFVQDASVTGIQYTGNAPVSFYPLNSELVHAFGILLIGRDVLSPVLNIGWLGFALLAGWCIGRPLGVGPGTMAATALLASIKVMAFSQAGSAKNDIVALSLLLAAVALGINGRGARNALILGAIAAGLAVGTRLNFWAPVLTLGAVAIIASPRGRRFTVTGWCAFGIVAGAAFWYGRNLVEAGNPLPWFGLKLAGIVTLPSTSAPADCGETSVAHYLTNPSFVKAHLLPQLIPSVGHRWWIVVSLAAAGVGAGLLSRRAPVERALAVVALVSGVAYVLTPATAGGVQASCFAFNTRFAAPALTLGVIVLVLIFGRRGVHPLIAVLIIAIAVVADATIPFVTAPVLVSGILVAGLAALALRAWRAVPQPALAACLVLLGLAAIAAGWHEQRIYFRDRYVQPRLSEPVEGVYAFLRHVSHARIAVTGFFEVYPLYGPDLSNRVELPAARIAKARWAPYADCRSWLRALQRGRYNYVVTAQQGTSDPPAAEWTRRYPGVREVLDSPPGTERGGEPWRWELFRLDPGGPVDPTVACARRRAGASGPRS